MVSKSRVALCLVLIVAFASAAAERAGAQAPQAAVSNYLPLVARSCADALSVRSSTFSHLFSTRLTTFQTVGEVRNLSSSPVYSVTLTLRVYNAATGALLDTQERPALLPQSSSTVTNPFKIEWSNSAPASDLRQEVSATCSLASAHTYAPLTVLSQQLDASTDSPTITGAVRNDGTSTVQAIAVAATIYDQSGQPLDAGGYQATVTLAPGAQAAYTITFNKTYSCFCDTGSPLVGRIAVQAQGQVAQ